MVKVSARVEHSLGAREAEARLRAAAEKYSKETRGFVTSIEWSGGVATVVGRGFSGRVVVGEKDVTIEADLGLPVSLFPLKAKREAQSFLERLLG